MYKLILFSIIFGSLSVFGYTKPHAFLGETKWWMTRQNKESVWWVDHTGKTNKSFRVVGYTNDIVVSSSRGIRANIDKDLNIVTYSISHASKDSIGNLEVIAPGTYSIVSNKWWTELTVDEKLSMWNTYSNKLVEAEKADRLIRYAPAKFDVSMTVDQYKSQLLGNRNTNTISRSEWAEINREVWIYKDEKERVEDPENWRRIPLPSMLDKCTERQKMSRRRFR